MDDKEFEEAANFVKTCKVFLVFFELNLDTGLLGIRHFVTFTERPSNETIEHIKDEVNTDPEFGCLGEVPFLRVALVEFDEPPGEVDDLMDTVANKLLDDLGFGDASSIS